MAQLFCPQIVFRHEGKPTESPQPTRVCDAPTDFFHHFAVQCLQGGFTRINATAGQLDVGRWFHLCGHQEPSL